MRPRWRYDLACVSGVFCRVMLSVWFLWNDITIVFDSLTRRCQSFSHFAAEVTESCKASWASSTDSCVVISAVSSANWLQVVERSVHVGGKSIVYMRNRRGPRTEP